MLISALLATTLSAAAATPALPVSTPEKEGLDPTALERLVTRARETKSDALVVLRNGKLVGEWYFDQPRGRIETMSMTKSVVSMAIGRLVTTGRIASLDLPLHTWFPELKQGRKERMTLRHVLTQTSGIQTEKMTQSIYASPDFVQLALAAELTDAPGEKFTYNNKAMNLLSEVVRRASGQPLDAFAAKELFAPLGIKDFQWSKDRAGQPHGMSGLQLSPLDVAKLGQLMLDEGRAGRQQVLSAEWVRESAKPAANMQGYGLTWWLDRRVTKFVLIDDALVAQWKAAAIPAEFVQKVLPLKDRVFRTGEQWPELAKLLGGEKGMEQWYDATWRRGLPDVARIDEVEVDGFYAQGWLGQWMVVRPKDKLVVVRMRRYAQGDPNPDDPALGYNDILRDIAKLVPAPKG